MPSDAERRRLDILRQYHVLDTPPEAAFDGVTQLAAHVCHAPIALLSLTDEHRQLFKSRVGLTLTETPRPGSFCARAIEQPELFIVPDAWRDARFAQNPLVTSEPRIRFYAGSRLLSPEGQALGTLCVMDHEPRTMTVDMQQALRLLGLQAMTQLDARRRRYELIDSVDGIVWEADAETFQFSFVSHQAERLLGYPVSRWLTEPGFWADHIHPADRGAAVEYCVQRTKARLSHEFEYRMLAADGRVVWLRDLVTVIVEHDRPTRLRGLMVDVTEQTLTEEGLRESERQMRLFMQATTDCLWNWDLITGSVSRSVGFNRAFGYSVEEMDPGIAWWVDRLHPEDRERVLSTYEATVAGGRHACSYEYRFRRKDGTYAAISDHVYILRDASDTPVRALGAMTDITERKEAEAALEATTERYRRQRAAIVELRGTLADAVDLTVAFHAITETAARILDVERVSVWHFNERRNAIVCQDLFESSPARHSSGMALLTERHPAYFRALAASDVIAADDARDDPRTCEFLEEYLEPPGIVSMMDASIHQGADRYGTLCHEHVGARRRWTLDEQSFAMSLAHLTALMLTQWEQKQVEERLRQSQKMEAVGQLAGGVAHDFNNVLTQIMMQASAAATSEGVSPEVAESLQDIHDSAERAAHLTRQLLAFGRRQVLQPQSMDLNVRVAGLVELLRRTLGEDVRIHLNLYPAMLGTFADASMIEQVLMNLVLNARDAMPHGGSLIVDTAPRVISDDEARLMPDAAPGRYVCLRVTDDGCGIPSENLPYIFEPFFTTKAPGKGTGLGLSTVFGIVKQHRGIVDVHSTVGRGTTFSVLLPASDITDAPLSVKVAASKPRSGTETVLVVEDEPGVRRLMRIALERQGYHVLEAGDGVEALRIWDQEGSRADLVLTDMVMPGGIGGRELAARLWEGDPGLKIIFTSGYSPELVDGDFPLREGQNFLQKPYAPSRLLEVVRRRLDE